MISSRNHNRHFKNWIFFSRQNFFQIKSYRKYFRNFSFIQNWLFSYGALHTSFDWHWKKQKAKIIIIFFLNSTDFREICQLHLNIMQIIIINCAFKQSLRKHFSIANSDLKLGTLRNIDNNDNCILQSFNLTTIITFDNNTVSTFKQAFKRIPVYLVKDYNIK